MLAELFTQIHRALTFLGESYEECAGMGATLSLCWFTPGWMYFGHVGDSRIYYLPAAGGIKQLSEDDTLRRLALPQRQDQRARGAQPSRARLSSKRRSARGIVRRPAGRRASACESGDMFLLCTDGVIDGLFDSGIADCIRAPEPADAALSPAQRLVKAALERSGRDNTTAIVVEVL